MLSLALKSTNKGPVIAAHIGTVRDVIAGVVPETLRKRYFHAHAYQYGFELASPEGIAGLGEAVLVNGMCYATSTDASSLRYLKTVSGDAFMTSGIFLIPNGVQPSHRIEQTFDSAYGLNDVYDALFTEIGQPLAFALRFDFDLFYGTYIGKAPIFGENIFEKASSYYSQAPETLRHVSAFLVGAIADFRDTKNTALLQALDVVLYHNPFDSTENLTTHAHGVTLTQNITEVSEITPMLVDRVWHVLSGESRVTSVRGEVFALCGLRNATLD